MSRPAGETLADLIARDAAPGVVRWIGCRPARLAPVVEVTEAELAVDGLAGDHARPGKRSLTLLQWEHLPVIAALAARGSVAPELLRRNLLISGINLTAARHATLRIGEAEVKITVPCAPCSRMETALGPGGYSALRGHGGWCAEVVHPGRIAVGDPVTRSPRP